MEIPTGYLTAEFNRFWTYEASPTLVAVFPTTTGSCDVSDPPGSRRIRWRDHLRWGDRASCSRLRRPHKQGRLGLVLSSLRVLLRR